MKCFIAMAFGYPDTDKLYDKIIFPILKKRDIDVIRIDRIEHNDDIDDRIIHEIKNADFIIADLTYARPSVYYEAGYAERIVPVIYTIRRDHLTPSHGDKFGNFRLHFDLQMKNIIDWMDLNDESFLTRLASRVDYVITPIRLRHEENEEQSREREAFHALSINQRQKKVEESASKIIKSLGFTPASEAKSKFGHNAVSWGGYSKYLKAENGVLSIIELSFHTDSDKAPCHYVDERPDYNINFNHALNKLVTVREYEIECAFFPISFDDVCHEMPEFSSVPNRKLLTWNGSLQVPTLDQMLVGEVYCELNEVKTSFGDYIGWSTGDFPVGFSIETVPAGMLSKKSDRKGFRFVYQDLKLRAIDRQIKYYLIDAIDSETSFIRRLKAELKDL